MDSRRQDGQLFLSRNSEDTECFSDPESTADLISSLHYISVKVTVKIEEDSALPEFKFYKKVFILWPSFKLKLFLFSLKAHTEQNTE